ncbi:MAG: PorT family protein [Bacteroidales bacterium]|jgi:hypothetical protein|nr:PorT family protein [Bacteroidales bacterium]
MTSINNCRSGINRTAILFFFLFAPVVLNAQQRIRPGTPHPMVLRFGVHADPVISWFSTDIDAVNNQGARPGFNFGLTINRYFTPNYSFSSGINIISAGGRLISDSTTLFDFSYKNTLKTETVDPGNAVIYKIQYLSIPLGLKLQTNQIGYFTFFTDLGIDPKMVIGGKVDIPSRDIEGARATKEIRLFNLSYHIMAGTEYSIGGNTAFVLGIGFDNNFFDITSDLNYQPDDKVSHKLLSFRFGVNF